MTWDDPVRGLSGMIPQVKDCVKDLEVTNYGASDAIPSRFPVNKTLTDGLCMVHQTGCAATRYNMVCSLHILNILYYFILLPIGPSSQVWNLKPKIWSVLA